MDDEGVVVCMVFGLDCCRSRQGKDASRGGGAPVSGSAHARVHDVWSRACVVVVPSACLRVRLVLRRPDLTCA